MDAAANPLLEELTGHALGTEATQALHRYGADFVKTVPLFGRGPWGLAGAAALYGLAQACPQDSLNTQVDGLALGVAKGALSKGSFAHQSGGGL